MSKVWRWVAIAFSVLMIFGIALLAVAYATGGSFERLIQTTDIADMTKFVSRDQLLVSGNIAASLGRNKETEFIKRKKGKKK